MPKYLKLEKYGRVIQITLQIRSYQNGNLAIQLLDWDAGYPELWNTLTVNLSRRCEKDCAFIDTNNNGDNILPWLIRHGLGVPTGVLPEAVIVFIRNFAFGIVH